MHGYLEATYASGSIAVSRQARELASAVMAPPLSAFIAPVVWANRLVTVGLLPARLREEYGFARRAGDDEAGREDVEECGEGAWKAMYVPHNSLQ